LKKVYEKTFERKVKLKNRKSKTRKEKKEEATFSLELNLLY